jgi:hypothetical protein
MEENVYHEGEMQEEQMTQAMNLPVVTARQIGKE